MRGPNGIVVATVSASAFTDQLKRLIGAKRAAVFPAEIGDMVTKFVRQAASAPHPVPSPS